jgi:ornithine--oxo-acid transaminase
MTTNKLIEKEFHFGAKNYMPVPLVLVRSKGVNLWDEKGKKYVDMVSAYSAVSLGHSNPDIIKVFKKQADKLGVTSRAFHNDKLPLFLEKITAISGMDKAIPMNSGAEAVETALKVARKWGEKVKGVEKDQCEIIACRNNFHGRTLGIVALSTEPQYKDGFGPFMPGVKIVDYNDVGQLKKAITKNTVAFILEPIQGEAGIITPDDDYLKKVREVCTKNNVLLIVDEIQTGLSRTGKLFCYEHAEIMPDLITVGKALGGGLYPVSAVMGKNEVMDVINPGDHGSTFGGNPIASAIAIKSLEMLSDQKLIDRVDRLGKQSLEYLKSELEGCSIVKNVRGKGLFIGIEFIHEFKAKKVVLDLMEKGVLTKDTHESVIRLAPPLIIKEKVLNKALKKIVRTIKKLNKKFAEKVETLD